MDMLSPKRMLAVTSRSGSRREFPFADWSSNRFQHLDFEHLSRPIRRAEIPAQLATVEHQLNNFLNNPPSEKRNPENITHIMACTDDALINSNVINVAVFMQNKWRTSTCYLCTFLFYTHGNRQSHTYMDRSVILGLHCDYNQWSTADTGCWSVFLSCISLG